MVARLHAVTTSTGTEMDPITALALLQVLQADVLRAQDGLLGITSAQALRNMGVLGKRAKATREIKIATLRQLLAQGVGMKPEDANPEHPCGTCGRASKPSKSVPAYVCGGCGAVWNYKAVG